MTLSPSRTCTTNTVVRPVTIVDDTEHETQPRGFGEFLTTKVTTKFPTCMSDFVEKATITLLCHNCQPGQIVMALGAIADAMVEAFGTAVIGNLSTKLREPMALIDFGRALTKYAHTKGWVRSTVYCIGAVVRKTLVLAGVHLSICKRIKIHTQKEVICPIVGRKYSLLAEDSPERKLLGQWIMTIRRKTRAKTTRSLSVIISFFCNSCLPAFGLSLSNWPANVTDIVDALLRQDSSRTINSITGKHKSALKRFKWMQYFVRLICGSAISLEMTDECYNFANPCGRVELEHDVHRISNEDLEKIDAAAGVDLRSHLQFRIMIMTGMRIGGMVTIKLDDIVDFCGSKTIVRKCARTIEKGQKEFTFYMNGELRTMVKRWVVRGRPSSASPYLFPSATNPVGNITTATARRGFRSLCIKANLSGKEFHPHGLRHSYAHILLEKGIPLAKVSTMLNHDSIKTTKAYTKENAIQRARRMGIDWMDEEDKTDTTVDGPAFMQSASVRKSHQNIPNALQESKKFKKSKKNSKDRKRKVVESQVVEKDRATKRAKIQPQESASSIIASFQSIIQR
jgi:integrase